MQQTPQMLNPSMNITTEQIQKYLDENKNLIMAILENQSLGKFAECASYQAQLQQNLMYLARIADAQPQGVGPQGVTMPSQMPSQSLVQQEHYNQPSQVAMSQQPNYFPPKLPFQLNDQQQQQQQQLPLQLQQQHFIHGQMRGRSGATDGDTEA